MYGGWWWWCRSTFMSLSLVLGPTVSLGIKHPSGAYEQILITVGQLRVCWCGALSLTRGRVCRLQLLLVLASAVILVSQSRGTHEHILLSQIRDFAFRHLLRLAGYGGRIRPRLHTGLSSTDSPPFLTWEINRGEWSASRYFRFTPNGERPRFLFHN
jgi:hypothetical protein